MNRTKIEWLDGGYTWNPVTGCYHKCPYCYAIKIVKRFGVCGITEIGIEELNKPFIDKLDGDKVSYPYGFKPTFHRYRLDKPQKIKRPQNIFVCSMADLFGKWVPDEWIKQVFEACEKAPWHRYLFLTKKPERYIELYKKGNLPERDNFWYGTTVNTDDQLFWWSENYNYFVSIEPIMGEFKKSGMGVLNMRWVIIGSETGNRKGKVVPKREWIENIVNLCRERNVSVFLKDSLEKIWGGPLIREYPWRGK